MIISPKWDLYSGSRKLLKGVWNIELRVLHSYSLAGLEHRWDFVSQTSPGRDISPVGQSLYEHLWGGNYERGCSLLLKRIPYTVNRGTEPVPLHLKGSECCGAPLFSFCPKVISHYLIHFPVLSSCKWNAARFWKRLLNC